MSMMALAAAAAFCHLDLSPVGLCSGEAAYSSAFAFTARAKPLVTRPISSSSMPT